MQKTHQSINYLVNRGNLKGFSEDENIDFIDHISAVYYFYDPYKDVFINPIASKTIWPKTLQSLYLNSKSSLSEKLDWHYPPTQLEIENSLKNIYSLKKRAYGLLSVIRIFKYLGLVLGVVFSYFVDIKLGLAVGLYLIYFDYNTFDKINGVISQVQNIFLTSIKWQKNSNLYFFGPIVIITLSLICLYFYINSIWLVIAIFFAQKWFIMNPLIRMITSTGYRGTEIVAMLEQVYQKQTGRFKISQLEETNNNNNGQVQFNTKTNLDLYSDTHKQRFNISFIVKTTIKKGSVNLDVDKWSNGNINCVDFKPPNFEGFKVIGGPNQNTKKTWIDGFGCFTRSYTYILAPLRTGVFTISEASIKINEEVYKSPTIKINISF